MDRWIYLATNEVFKSWDNVPSTYAGPGIYIRFLQKEKIQNALIKN